MCIWVTTFITGTQERLLFFLPFRPRLTTVVRRWFRWEVLVKVLLLHLCLSCNEGYKLGMLHAQSLRVHLHFARMAVDLLTVNTEYSRSYLFLIGAALSTVLLGLHVEVSLLLRHQVPYARWSMLSPPSLLSAFRPLAFCMDAVIARLAIDLMALSALKNGGVRFAFATELIVFPTTTAATCSTSTGPSNDQAACDTATN